MLVMSTKEYPNMKPKLLCFLNNSRDLTVLLKRKIMKSKC